MSLLTLTVVAKDDKGVYIIEKDGEELQRETFRVFESTEDLLKRRTIEVLIKGLLAIRDMVKHDDTLTIKLENVHLVNWLITEYEYQGYEKLKDAINLIDNLDCKVCIEKTNMRKLRRKLEKTKQDTEEVMDFARIMMDE